MSKNLKLSYILFFVFSAIIIAWHTLSNFFSGVGLNFIALIAIVFVNLLLVFSSKELLQRIKDLLIIACVFCVLELVIYFACEFGYGETLKGFTVYQNIISFLALIFFGYTSFRFSADLTGKKIAFVETILGNQKRTVKEKKAKELTNGCLEEKPNQKNDKCHNHNTTSENIEIIISEDEE